MLLTMPTMALSEIPNIARPENNQDPRFDGLLVPPIPKVAPTQVGEPTLPPEQSTTKEIPKELTLEDLKNNFALTEQLLNQAMLQKNWNMVHQLLVVYKTFPEQDQVLVWYVQGALYRQQGKHKEAIQAYQNILALKPDLIYTRFDLAIMLFENKEYVASLDQFRKVKAGNIKEQYQVIADQYIVKIQEQSQWDVGFSAQYTQNNNVNNASDIKEFSIYNGAVFVKDEESLPQKATGIRYGLYASRDVNLQGNHYWTFSGGLNGVQYWDNTDFNEQTARISSGYKYQNINSWLSLTPYVERNWYGGKPYLDTVGITTQYGRWFNSQWQGSVSYSLATKKYVDNALNQYNGNLHAGSAGVVYLYSPSLIVIGGLEYQRESLNSEDSSYQRYGARVGVIKEFNRGISTRLDLGYGHRKYDKESFLTQIIGLDSVRKDDDYRASLTFWHRAIRFWGVTPKLTVGYNKVSSNLPMYYSRKNTEAYLSFDKSF